ncbi:IgG-binding virulence factor TspB family protein, partial [Neisseria mucosa]|uniref:IgG-binding virulence factor TspB family protein n=1 Tax=Neisseria mucosa TaxID=488 RepID=UPI001E65AFA4
MSFLVKNSYAEWKAGPPFPGSNGTVRPLYDSSKVNLNPNTMYKTDTGHYGFKTTISQTIEHVPTGATRAGVPTIFEAQVSRKAVLSGAFNLVKRGAALGTRLSGWGTAAYFAYEAYQAVKPSLESEGYEYKKESNEFYKNFNDSLCYSNSRTKIESCIGVDSSVIKALKESGDSKKSAETLLEMQVSTEFQKILPEIIEKESSYKGAFFKECKYFNPGVSCLISTGTRFYYSPKHGFRSETLTEEKFLQIATPSIDGNPTPFVEGTGKPEYKENIKVPAGTVVTIGPVTPENGKPVQISITFGQDSNGNTTAEVATTQRPDLTPGGSEAPNTKPDPDPKPNPDGKPDKKPNDKPDSDDKPDKRPDDKPDSDDDPSDKDKRKEDKKDDKKEESKGLLCNVFPDILACSEKGDIEEQEEP